jgi:hypothetical protein
MVTVMRPPHGLVRACLRWTVPATNDTTDHPRRCVTNEADANRPLRDFAVRTGATAAPTPGNR